MTSSDPYHRVQQQSYSTSFIYIPTIYICSNKSLPVKNNQKQQSSCKQNELFKVRLELNEQREIG